MFFFSVRQLSRGLLFASFVSLTALMSFGEDGSPISNDDHLPPLVATQWNLPDLHVGDAVAVSFDSKGRLYVVETYRRASVDLDVRPMRELRDLVAFLTTLD
jgi:hypothetical protein